MPSIKEQYSQTGASLCSIYDSNEGGFLPMHTDDDDEPDYDDVATDISSLHYHLHEIANKRQAPHKEPQMKTMDAWPQIFAALLCNLLPMQAGINMSYSAIIIPQLSLPTAAIPLSTAEASWIASLVTISLPVGSLTLGPLIDRFGRKRIAVIATLPFLLGWILVATAQNVTMLYCARILCGIGGGFSTVSIIYVSEITEPNLRPALLGLNSVYVSLGILLTSVLGMFYEWRLISIFYLGVTVITSFLLLFVPESPRWLVTFRSDEARSLKRSMHWLYRRETLYEARLDQIRNIAQPVPSQQPLLVGQSSNPMARAWYRIYMQPQVYKPLCILLVMFLFQQLSGGYVVIFYAVNLFLKIGGHFGEGINEYGALLMLASIRFVMSIVASLLSQKVGRRKLMFMSGLGMSVCTLVAGLYMYYDEMLEEYYARTETPTDDIDPERKENDVVLLICVLGYVMFCALGFMVIPWILIGEILPTQVKGTLGGVVITVAYVMMFGAVKAFPYVLDELGAQGVFYVFSTASFLGVVFVFVYLPETLGKSFEEIEMYFTR